MRQLHLNTSVGFNEFGVDLPASFTGFPIGVVPPHLLAAVPKVKPNYVFRPETLQIMAAWWQVGIDEPLFINGPHGSGKTSFVEQFCARIGAPLISVTARSRLDRTDLIGHYVIAKDKTMRFADGPLTRAFRDGCIILFNEMSAAPADLWLSINELLEGSPIYIEATNEVVPKHPNCRIVMTDNTRGLSSDDANYQSRHIQDAAVMDRCWKLRMEYMNSEAEEKLLRDTTPSVQLRGMAHHDWTSLMAKRLTKAANQIRKAYHTEGSYLGATMSTRSLLRFRDLLIMAYATAQIRDNDPMAWALRVALTEAADPASALAIHKIVEAEVGDLGKYIMTA